MQIVVLFNPVSGSGRGRMAAQEICAGLDEAGHTAHPVATRIEKDCGWLDEALRNAQVLAVVGGDGAVRMAAGSAAGLAVPLYHVPCGTENLFAREFGMTRSPSQLVNSVNAFNVRRVDLAYVNGHAFTLMASVGLDAEVVHDLTQRRGPAISHLSYAWPVTKQLAIWKPPELTITVDGQPLVALQRGQVIIANSRQYGWRLNPAAEADMADGLLDVVFFPARTKLQLVTWAWRCVRRRQLTHPKVIHARGMHVLVNSPQHATYQIDGDPPPPPDARLANQETHGETESLRLEIRVQPGALPVLLPAGS